MALKMKVLVTRITNLTDARYCAGMEVDFLGFPATLEPALLRDIRAWVVGPSFWVEAATTAELAMHPHEEGYIIPYALAMELSGNATLPSRWMVRLTAADVAGLLARPWQPDYVLLDESVAAEGEVSQELCKRHAVLIFGRDERAVARATAGGAQGVYLLGDHEERPGLRDFDFLSGMFEVLEKAE